LTQKAPDERLFFFNFDVCRALFSPSTRKSLHRNPLSSDHLMIPNPSTGRPLMATAILNPVLSSVSGSVGSLLFYQRHGKTIMRA